MTSSQTPSETPAALSARGITRRFSATAGLDACDLDVPRGAVTALLGASGAGKSTLLRVLAGLEPVEAGEVLENGEPVSRPGRLVPPERRNIGLVFQDHALFPHLSALDNVLFGLHRMERNTARRTAEDWLARVGLAGRGGSFPHQLSGGEQQRVGLARALAPGPAAVLMDEPFSGLDPALREGLQQDTLAALRASGVAALIVTHDTAEALAVADRVAVMAAGRILQAGAPSEVYANPVSIEVARAMGPLWTWPAQGAGGLASTPFGPLPAPDGPVTVWARPEDTILEADPEGGFVAGPARGVGRLRTIQAHADHPGATGRSIVAWMPSDSAPDAGCRVRVRVAPGLLRVEAGQSAG